MKQRIITAIAIIVVAVPCIYFGGLAFDILAAALVGIACYEVLDLFSQEYPKWVKGCYYVLFVGSCIGICIDTSYVTFLSLLTLIVLFSLVIWENSVRLYHIGITYLIYSILLYTICTFLLIYDINKWLLAFLLVGNYVNDSFCMFGGMAFGKHKLNTRISPNKTIEGCISGWVVGSIAGIALGMLTMPELPTVFIVAAGLTIPIMAQVGDLAFSAIKRHYGIKDFGKIFPGHGGVLDRIDSLGFSSLWLFALMSILL